jgi:translocator protein
MSDYGALLMFMVITVVAAGTGSKYMPGPWYLELRKPTWTPPSWAFPVVWSILYVLIAVAGWRVWVAAGLCAAIVVWVVQLVFNAAWSWIMFGRKNIRLALFDAIAMWITIATFMVLAWPIDQAAVWMFAPYLLWVSIATVLNATILQMNPHFSGAYVK